MAHSPLIAIVVLVVGAMALFGVAVTGLIQFCGVLPVLGGLALLGASICAVTLIQEFRSRALGD